MGNVSTRIKRKLSRRRKSGEDIESSSEDYHETQQTEETNGESPAIKQSLYRVGSVSDDDLRELDLVNSNSGEGSEREGSQRARTSTYGNVRDAAMMNLSAVEPSKHDQSVPMGVIGLKNLGNTCFINSSLQCLSATIPLTDYFLGFDYRSEINKENFLGTGGKLATAYAELMKKMWVGTNSSVHPGEFKSQLGTFAPQFDGYRQHDSQELLAFLLDGIHEDLNRVKNRPYIEDKDCDGKSDEKDAIESWKNYLQRNKSLVVDLFQGQLKNTCTCLTCGHKNIRFEPFMYLSLPINRKCRSIEDCMKIYLQEETLTGMNQWYCSKCKEHRDATKKTDFWILPPILIVHLKRFKYDETGQVGSKNEQPIQYPVSQWDLKSKVKSRGTIYPKYDLYAVSNHMGGLGGGHYTALALNRFDDQWYEFNDSSYRSVDASVHRDHHKTAYVLFYNRSEGDSNMPLNDRAPVIRRQSVSRPDLWPHTQVDDPSQIRAFRRSRAYSGEYKSGLKGMGSPLQSPNSPRRAARAGTMSIPQLPISPVSPRRQSRIDKLLDEGEEKPSSERKKERRKSPKDKSNRQHYRRSRSRSGDYSRNSSRSGSEERASNKLRKGKKKKER
ncbi:unnamed protein product [Cylindrotheca closterium]|uniref:Ubiquitin carboxyl-terminal hydrolase n=1 Tax=Cylindrotheca closterium TaxID=2856 RepID=A0AAD2JKF5_9STRA|nr:unnamed protein product [Cylindrotheca closterium]